MGWLALGESATGTSHHARNIPCQDAFRYCVLGATADRLVVAVADGAGSAAHSDVGATVLCDELLHLVEVRDWRALVTREAVVALFTDARRAILSEAERLSVRPRELACTALLALVGPDGATFGQIGDGAIVVGNGGTLRTVFWPEPAEYANATDFLTDEQFAAAIHFEAILGTLDEIAVLTDGLQRVALDFATRTAHPPFFQPLFNELRKTADSESLVEPFRNFLESPRLDERTDDDKTLVIAINRP